MKINGLQVDNFGVWNDLTIGDLPDDITVFYGPNEAGKSTLMNFVRTILFGFSPEKCQRFLTGPLGQQRRRMGGRIRVQGYEGQFYIRRYADEIDPLGAAGDVRVTTVDNSRVGGHKLASLLSGIDEAIYNNVFCLGMGEIQQLSSLNDTQAAQFLYSLSTGTDRVSLVDVMRQLRTARKKLVGNGKPGLLTELIRRRDEQRAHLEQLGRLTDNWGQLQSELTSLNSEVKRLEGTRQKQQRQSRTMEIAAGLRPKWLRRQRIEKELVTLGVAPEVPKGIFDKLRSIDDRIVQRQHEVKSIRERHDLLSRSEKELGIRDGLQRNAARVKALLDQRSWITTLDEEVRRLETRAEETEFEIHAELEKLGIGAPEDGSDIFPTIDADTLSALRSPARLLKSAKHNLDKAKREATEHKANAERIAAEMTRQLGGKADWLKSEARNDVSTMMEQTGALAQNARRRVELGREVRSLAARLDELESSRSRLLQQQFLPRPVIVALASVFGLGSMMLLSSIFGVGTLVSKSTQGYLFLIGAITCGVGVLVKVLLDSTHRDVLSGTDSERRRISTRITDANEEITRIDATLPSGTSFEQVLNAGDGLDELDQLLPLDTERRNALDRAALAEKRAIDIATSMKETRLQWEKALVGVGLPSRLTPTQVEQLAGRTGNLQFLRRRFQDVQDQLDRAQRELGIVHNRIAGLMTEARIESNAHRPLEQLDQLAKALREQESLVTRRSDVRRQLRELKRQEDRLTASIRRLETKRNSLLTSAKATDETELRRLEELRVQIESLNRQQTDLAEEITASLAAAEDEAALRRELERNNDADFKKRLQRLRDDASQVEKQLAELLQRRGELSEQIRATTEDRQLPNAHIRLAIIEQQLRDGLARWKELSATTYLLRRVYKRYEKDRQPETLQHASEYLSRMTGRRYNRIWTPLAEDVLLIDDSAGHSLPIEVLSRGTREQVFLALRLALVSGYARRGVKMPMVLDDVLVNFDIDRTVAAAEVLVDFARAGHQVFIFTCHDHIMRVFQDHDAELRDLPRHDNELLSTTAKASPAYQVTPGVRLLGGKVAGRVPTPSHESSPQPALASVGADSFQAEALGDSFLGDSMLPTRFGDLPAAAERVPTASNSGLGEARAVIQELPTASSLPVDTLPTSALVALASPTGASPLKEATQFPKATQSPEALQPRDRDGTGTVQVEATPIPKIGSIERVTTDLAAEGLVHEESAAPHSRHTTDNFIGKASELKSNNNNDDDDCSYNENLAETLDPPRALDTPTTQDTTEIETSVADFTKTLPSAQPVPEPLDESLLQTTEVTTELSSINIPPSASPLPDNSPSATNHAPPLESETFVTEIAQSLSEPPIVPTMAVVQDLTDDVDEVVYEENADEIEDFDDDEIEVEIVDELEVEDAPASEEDEYEYVEEEDEDADVEEDSDEEAYEYVDEEGNPIRAEDLAEDDEYEWVEDDGDEVEDEDEL